MMRRAFLCIAGLAAALSAHAHVFCVNDSAGLSAALASAAGNGEDDRIELVRGTYAGGGFSFNSSEGHALDISGGWDAACAASDGVAAHTVLDGGGMRQVLLTFSNGALSIGNLTVRNGLQSGSSGGGMALLGSGAAGSVSVSNTIVRDNASDYAVGGITIDVEGDVTLVNNLIVGNSAPGSAAAYIYVGAPVNVLVSNNTISANTVTSAGNDAVYVNVFSAGAHIQLDNNIVWGNSADHDLGLGGSVQLDDNDIGTLGGAPAAGSTGNVSVDPRFKSAHDWHLRADSPLVGSGSIAPAGGLAAADLDARPRSYLGTVDPGAYERGEAIFSDGFDG